MATVTDAKFSKGFDAAKFRAAIRSTMTMTAPNTVADRATFKWAGVKAYTPQDPAHRPYTWTETPISDVEHPDVQVPVAVEFSARPGGTMETNLGEFDASRVIITVLDVDFVLVSTADHVTLGQNSYKIMFTAPPIALFSVDVYQVYAVAEDES